MKLSCLFVITGVVALVSVSAASQPSSHRVVVDASSPAPVIAPVLAKLGSSRSPAGDQISVNSQYLTLNGRPWLPVMGEFHFSRFPEEQWEREILKMKAAGIDIISTYVIWIHHEQVEGVFDWKGQRDLRHFVELCKQHGMYVYPRIGPWAHAEVRNGGFPDWVLNKGVVRTSDPVYLQQVQRFYAEIFKQLRGLLWKDGGPVIGTQIENEYRGLGKSAGEEHIRALKQMAIAAGVDVPLYTVTGWDGAAIPLDAVLPVYGGYADAPWDASSEKLPPNEVYAFRFANRIAGSMGAIGGKGQSAAESYRGTPFLTAEVGAGTQDTYFRRPVLSTDDVAAIAPVMLGSGVNLLGYYMFHGGRNPDGGGITLQESQKTGYPTDVPVKSYDFQAPLGEFGQERDSLRKLKLVHYFLHDFGEELAPMAPHQPEEIPADPADTTVPRVSVRTLGEHGFIFFNNHVRGLEMPLRKQFQIEVKLPSGTVRVPETPIDLPPGAYGIWPLNYSLNGTMLRYSTAQLFKQVRHKGEVYYFFFSVPGLPAEFVFAKGTKFLKMPNGITPNSAAAGVGVSLNPSREAELQLDGGVHVVLVPQAEAEQVWAVDDRSVLVKTPANLFSNSDTWTLESLGNAEIPFAVFGDDSFPAATRTKVLSKGREGVFQRYSVTLREVPLDVKVVPLQEATTRAPWEFGPAFSWRPKPTPLAPSEVEFDHAATWKMVLPDLPKWDHIANVLLQIQYQGDVGRLYGGDCLLDDDFWNGVPWMIGLRELREDPCGRGKHFHLSILPLPQRYPMYLEKASELDFEEDVANRLVSVKAIPQYQVVIHTGH
jgi:beta-galactosidase